LASRISWQVPIHSLMRLDLISTPVALGNIVSKTPRSGFDLSALAAGEFHSPPIEHDRDRDLHR
jgi:hypothetical protein